MSEEEMFKDFKKFFQDLFAEYFHKKAAVDVVPAGPPVPPSAYDTPDANGFVALSGVGDQNVRHAILEVSNTLAPNTFHRASCKLNVGQAQGEWITAQFIGSGVECEQFDNQVTGAVDYRIKQPTTNIPNTMAWPPIVNDKGYNLAKVQGVTDWVNYIASQQNTGANGFAHPK